MKMQRLLAATIFAATCGTWIATASAATFTWQNGNPGPESYWSEPSNWSPNGLPTSGDSITGFSVAGAMIDLGGTAQSIDAIGATGAANAVSGSFINGTLSLALNCLYIKSGAIGVNLTGSATSRVWTGGDTTANIVLSGDNSGLNFSDKSNFILGHKNMGYGGTVTLGHVNALGGASSVTNLYSGAIDFNGITNVAAGTIGLCSGGSFGSTTYLINNTATDVAYGGSLIVKSAGTNNIGGSGNMTLLGNISTSSTGGIAKIGSGLLTLSGSNSYTGATTVSAGTLAVSNGGVITGAGSVTVAGGATLAVLNGGTLGSGNVSISGGTLVAAGTGKFGSGGRLLISNGGVVDLGGTSQTVYSIGQNGTPINGTIKNGSIIASNSTFMRDGTLSANLVSGGAGDRLCVGGGTAYLNGDNSGLLPTDGRAVVIGHQTYTGVGGTVTLGNTKALGGGSTFADMVSGTLDFNGLSGVEAGSIRLLTLGTSGGSVASVINSSTASDVTYAGGLLIKTHNATNIGGDGNMTLTGAITYTTGSIGGINKIGAGTLTLANQNAYLGNTGVEGTLVLGSGASMLMTLGSATGECSKLLAYGASGSVQLDGTLNLDVSAVTDATGSWNLVDSALSTAYNMAGLNLIDGGTTLAFTGAGNSWSCTNGTELWTFSGSAAGGILTLAVPEPSTFAMLSAALLGLIAYAWRKRK